MWSGTEVPGTMKPAALRLRTSKELNMSSRDARKNQFAPEKLEGRLAPTLFSGGIPPPAAEVRAEVHHDGPGDKNPDRPDRDRGGDGSHIHANWEPKPIGHGSTRPNVPSGPVRWMGGGGHDHDGGDHDH